MVFVMLVVAAIRGMDVGTDTINYYDEFIYQTSTDFSDKGEKEIVYSYINYFFRKFLNYDLYMFFMYGLILIPVAIVIKKKSTNLFLSLFLLIACGFYTNSFNVMRQFVSVSIMLLGLLLLEYDNKKRYLFWLLLIFAYFIHNSSLILFPLYFLRKASISKLWMSSIVIVSFIIGFFLNNLLGDFYHYLAELEVGGRLNSYFEYESSSTRNFITNFGMNVVFLILLLFVSNNYKDSIFFKAFFISMIVFNFVGNMYYMTRLTFFYSITQIICIPIILSELLNRIKQQQPRQRVNYFVLQSVVFVVLIFGYSLMRFYMKELTLFLPYEVRSVNLFNF